MYLPLLNGHSLKFITRLFAVQHDILISLVIVSSVAGLGPP